MNGWLRWLRPTGGTALDCWAPHRTAVRRLGCGICWPRGGLSSGASRPPFHEARTCCWLRGPRARTSRPPAQTEAFRASAGRGRASS
eukprot:321577-Alexandrium_andersonii.AAC.1